MKVIKILIRMGVDEIGDTFNFCMGNNKIDQEDSLALD